MIGVPDPKLPLDYPFGHTEGWIDIGNGHLIAPTVDDEGGPVMGWLVAHRRQDGQWCVGAVNRTGSRSADAGYASWDVESLEPLSLSPSIRCGCGDHGFIKHGRWVAV